MLGEALRLLRVFHDVKPATLCDELGISRSYLSEIESGKKAPTLNIITKYSSVFGISSSSIMLFSEKIENEESPKTEVGRIKASRQILKVLLWITQDGEKAGDVQNRSITSI